MNSTKAHVSSLARRGTCFFPATHTADPLVAKNVSSRMTSSIGTSVPQTQNGPCTLTRARAAGGTVGIDQEVVTLRGLFGNSGFPA